MIAHHFLYPVVAVIFDVCLQWHWIFAATATVLISIQCANYTLFLLRKYFRPFSQLPDICDFLKFRNDESFYRPLLAVITNPSLAIKAGYGGWLPDIRVKRLIWLSEALLILMLIYPGIAIIVELAAPEFVSRNLDTIEELTSLLKYLHPALYWSGWDGSAPTDAARLAEHLLAVIWAIGLCTTILFGLVTLISFGSPSMRARLRACPANFSQPILGGLASIAFGVIVADVSPRLFEGISSELGVYVIAYWFGELAAILVMTGIAVVTSVSVRAWFVRKEGSVIE